MIAAAETDRVEIAATTTVARETPPLYLPATEPAEARGIERDEVRLMVSHNDDGTIAHARFRDLADFLREGDLLLINTSRTIPAALRVRRENGRKLELHLSTHLHSNVWVVELRLPAENATLPFAGAIVGERLHLPESAYLTILSSYPDEVATPVPFANPAQPDIATKSGRLWRASLHNVENLESYLARHGRPIRYGYVKQEWPLSYYQTIFAHEPGSAEMPSAGRAFTHAMVTDLLCRGIRFAPLLLHTGVASQEHYEPPYPEYFRVSAATAGMVNYTRASGGRVIGVGTTAVRAIESATGDDGVVAAAEGWTNLVISPERGVRVVDGILSGLHEPEASHLNMLAAITPVGLLAKAYREAIERGYLWHEFGDLHLVA